MLVGPTTKTLKVMNGKPLDIRKLLHIGLQKYNKIEPENQRLTPFFTPNHDFSFRAPIF